MEYTNDIEQYRVADWIFKIHVDDTITFFRPESKSWYYVDSHEASINRLVMNEIDCRITRHETL